MLNDKLKQLQNQKQQPQQNQQAQQTQGLPSVQKTAYQQNLSAPVQQNNKWYKGDFPTSMELYGRIYSLNKTDPAAAAQLNARFMQEQQTPGSNWYAPYNQATNQAVNVLQSYGIDTNMLTDEWFQNNTAWQQSLRFGNTTNTPLAPLKNATDDQIVAFNLYQYQYSEPTTKKAEQEWAALQQELTYKATRKDRNYSDDDIINSIDWNKYQTLKAMNDGKTKGAVTELNRAVNFSDDSMRGVLWAARNGGSSGNIMKDMAMYGLGEGNKWVEDPEMRAKLAWGNPETYSPYQVGMTLDEEVGMYFNVPYIDRQTLNHLRATIDDSDKTSMSMYNKAAKSVDNAEKAQEQRDKLYAWIDKNIGNKSEEWLLKNLDVKLGNKDYAMLKAMDESIDNGSDLVQMGTAVDYRKQDVIDYIRRKKAELGGNGTAPDIANGTAGSAKTKEQVQQEAEDIHRRNRIKDPEYTGTEKDAYDSVNGEGAYQRDIAAAESLTSQSQAQKDSDQYVNDTVGDIEDELTPGESSRLNGYSGASDQAQQTVKANKDAMVSGEESPDAIIQKNNEEITKGWIEGTVDIYPRTIKYEQTQANLDFAKKQIEDINAKLGDKVFAGQTQDTSFTMEINGDLYRITLSPDLSEIEGIDNVNKSDTPVPVYASFGLYDSPEEYDADTQVWDAVEKSGQVEAFREKYAQETEKINAANKLEITDEDRELMKQKRQYEIQVEDNEQYLRDYKDQYDADITVFKRLSERRAAHIQNLKDMGASTTEVETADAALNALTGFTSYEATQWDYYNPSYAYAYKIENGEDRNTVLQQAEAEHEEMLEQIKDVEWLKNYCDRHKIEIGNDVRRNMDRRIAKLQRDTQDYEYFRLQFSDDFDKVAEEQRKIDEKISSEYIASHVMNDTHLPQGTLFYDFNGYDRYLTDDEKNTWYYLKAKDEQNGTNKAEEYAKFMTDDTYGVLMTRAAMGIEEGAKALTGQEGTAGLGFTAGNITAVLLSPYTAVASGIYRAKTLFTGEEINPNSRYLQTTKFRSAVREQSAQEILETFGKPIVDEKTGKVTGYESNLLSKGVQMIYEMLSNRADSMINSASFGWMFGGIGNKVLRELLSASPMGMSAGMEAAARAKERGATDAQASAIGLCTFLAETGTEAISLENMSKAFEIGEITGPGSYKQFLVNWLTKAGISEMVGESTNDIVENLADEWIMGELSEHAETVYQYRLAGMGPDEAELAARKDEVRGVLRTALMSYLTPGLDVFQTMRGRMGYFSEATDKLNAENPDKKLTIRQVRKQMIEEERSEARKQREKIQKQKQDAHEPGEIDYDALEERYAPEQTEEEKAAEEEAKTAEEEAKVKEGKQNTVDFEILETAKTYDKAGKSAAIAAVLDEGSTQDETDTANAASVRLDKIMGPNADPSSELQDLLLGAKVANGDISTSSIKQGIMYSALGGEQSQSRQVMQSDEYQKATPAVKATMLAEAAQQDAQNPDVVKNVANAVREDRIAKQMGVLMANGAAEKIGQAEVKVDFAKLETQKAQKGLDTQRGIEKTAREKQQSMVAESVQNPNNKQMAQDAENAMRDLIDQAKVTREYEQSVKNAQQREDDAVRNAEKVRQKTLSDIRKQAEQYVAQEDQQRAAVAEQQRIEQEAKAVKEEKARVQQEAVNNADVADVDAFIDLVKRDNPNLTEEDEKTIREKFAKIVQESRKQQTDIYDERDADGKLTEQAKAYRNKALEFVNRKFGLPVVLADDITQEDDNGVYSEGFFDENNRRIVLSNDLSFTEIMTRVLPHELLHSLEKAGTYNGVVDSLLGTIYGKDADFEQAIKNLEKNGGKATTRLERDILHIKQKYDDALGGNHSYRYAAQEIAATRMGEMFYNPNNPQRSQELIERLAADKPSAAKQIMNSIKSMIKKALGMKGAWLDNAQKTVDMFEKALSKNAEDVASSIIDYIFTTKTAKGHPTVYLKNDPGVGTAIDLALRDLGMRRRDYDGKISYFTPNDATVSEAAIRNAIDGNKYSFNEKRILDDSEYKDYSPVPEEEWLLFPTEYDEIITNNFSAWKRGDEDYHERANGGIIVPYGNDLIAFLDADGNVDHALEVDVDDQEIRDEIYDAMGQAEIDAKKEGVDSFGAQQEFIAKLQRKGNTHFRVPGEVKSRRQVRRGRAGENARQDSQGNRRELPIQTGQRATDSGELTLESIEQSGIWEDLKDDPYFSYLFSRKDKNKYSILEERIAKPSATEDNGDVLTESLEDGTTTKYSLSSWTDKEIKAVRKNLAKHGFSAKEIDQWIADVNSIAKIIADDKDRLDFIPDRDQKFKKPNGDVYKWTLDASTLCAKRLLYQGTFNAIQQALPNTPLRPGDLIELANMMHEMGYQTPCGICYVESRRRHLGNFTEEFLADYKGEYIPTYAELTSTDGLAKLKQEHRQAYDDYIAAMNGKGVASPKVVQLRTDYRGDVRNLTKDSIAYLNSIGGLRIQSFSDFETPHLMDMMQAVIDMAAVKLKSQAYTKVPNFAWVFGDTGIKINLSLMGEGTGVDENGQLIFSNTEGMDFEEAMKLRSRYSKNVGTILVGMNDEHIIAAMGDGRIDYIIPFHKSGWSSEELAKMKALQNYTDYQDTQNELWIVGVDKDGKYITKSIDKKTGSLDPYGDDGYWDYEKSGRENAEEYLRRCAKEKRLPKFSQFLVDNGDGSFSLPQGDDTRSTNIREGYWKTLIDFKMYDNDGVGAPQQAVMPDINMDQAIRVLNEYKAPEGGNNALPVADPVVDRYVEWYKETHKEGKKYSLLDDLLYDSPDESEDERELITADVKDLKEEFDPTIYDGRLYVKPETLEYWLSGSKYASPSNPIYSRAYIAMMNPADFVRMTTTRPEQQQRIYDESVPLDNGVREGKTVSLEKNAKDEPIQLTFNEDTGKIEYHQGRHRCVALARAGVTQVPVVLIDERESAKYKKTKKEELTLEGQNPKDIFGFEDTTVRNGNKLTLKDVVPISSGNRQELFDRFTASAEEEADAAQKGQRILRYSLPSDAPYMAAVERGEMDEAQRMVDEKAKEAGYDVQYAVWRGDFEPYTVLEPGVNGGNLGTGLYFTPNRSYAEKFASRNSPVRKFYLKTNNTFSYDTFTQEFNDYAMSWLEENDMEPTMNVDEYTWSMIWDDFISENGYDSVSATGVGGMSSGASEIAVQNSWQAKLADPVTYDDSGEVIPLSERFNDQNEDIRYALPSDDILDDMIRQYLKKGGVLSENKEVADRDVALVKDGTVPLKQLGKMLKTDKGEGTRQWGTGMAQNMDELADQARQFVLDHSAYQRDTNKAQIDRAVAWVKQLPTQGNETTYDKAVSYVTSDAFRRGGARTADGRAKLAVVMGMAVARNDASAQVLIADMTNKTATNIGQALQAQKLFKLMTPEGRIGTLQRMLDDQKVALQRRGKNAVAENLKFSDWVIRAAGLAETETDMKQVRDAALDELAKQIPMNWKDRLTSFRMLSMLFNPRTHIRNVVGNALFVPAVGMKNKLAAIAEAMTLEKGERTKTLAPILNKSIREFAKMDAETMKGTLTGEAKFNESGSLVARQQKGLAKLNGNLLELEDWLFLKGHYRRALGGWMQANGYTVEDVKNNHQLLEKGRAYAIEEAQKATYRDFSKTADALNKISKQGGALGFIVDAALPFKKTPINILRRGIEYSPVGIAKGLKNLMFHMNEYTEYQKALEAYEAGETTTAPVMPDKAVSPNQVIDQICSGLSGTAVMTLGFLLAGCGAVTCGMDDDEDKFDKAKGEQEYALNLGKAANSALGLVGIPKLFGEDVSMTIDWAAPMCMPFFVGAAIREQAEKENLDIEAMINAFGGITEPVFNLSMLDGVNTLLKTNSYDKTNPIAQIGSKLALNYAGSFVPSALGAVARTFFDDKQRKAFVPGDQKGVVSNAMYTLEQAQNKVPIWNQQNIAARNIWGEEKTSSFIERLVENFISPGYFNKVEDDPIINEMGRLYDVTGDNKMIPDEDPDKKITFTKDKVKQEVVLTDKQWDEYKRVRGQTAKQELTELINSESYQNASDSAKLQMMKDVWSHADKVGKNAVVSDIEVDNKPVSQIAKESKITGYESEMIKYLNNGDFEDYDNAAEAIRQEYDDDEEADAEIRQKLMNYYREMYKKAYRAGGLEGQTRMNEIEEALEYTGLVDESDFMRWQNAVDKALDDET